MMDMHGEVTPSVGETITWAKWNGSWALRVTPAASAAVVAEKPSVLVTARRTGRTKRVSAGRVLARFPDAAIVAHAGPERPIAWHR